MSRLSIVASFLIALFFWDCDNASAPINKRKLSSKDSARKADSCSTAKRVADSIMLRKIKANLDTMYNTSRNGVSQLDEMRAESDINYRILLNDYKISYSKKFTPTISFNAYNNWKKEVDAFKIRISFIGDSAPIEKSFERTIQSSESELIKFSLTVVDQVKDINVIKIHYSDGSIFTEQNSYQSSPYAPPPLIKIGSH